MALVKNLNGTSDNNPPAGYVSWREWWEVKKGRKFSTCSRSDCSKSAEVGAHVQKVGPSNKWYIVPLCKGCNNEKKDLVFEVRDEDLEPINP